MEEFSMGRTGTWADDDKYEAAGHLRAKIGGIWERDRRIDFIALLEPMLAAEILKCLDSPGDVIRAACVSSQWKAVVVEHGVSKKICHERYPQLGSIGEVDMTNTLGKYKLEMPVEEKEHVIYAALLGAPAFFEDEDCTLIPISSSSTRHFLDTTIRKTLEHQSAWCSKGSSNPQGPENLIYELPSDICYITRIDLTAFQLAGGPAFAARSVRFSMGYPKGRVVNIPRKEYIWKQASAEDDIHWLHTSKTFPMEQHGEVQSLVLDEPCKMFVGGLLKIEFLDRVQMHPDDGLYCIGISQVRVIGRPIPRFFFSLQYSPKGGPSSLSYDAGSYKFQCHW